MGKQSRELFKKNPSDGSQGWGSHAGEWKNKTRPPITPGANRDTNIGGLFTATRQRLDMFTSKEQDILKDVEPIMQNIRWIMQQSGYNDGDPLATEDHTFVIENVFEHHPDKAAKMGAGIDYVMGTSTIYMMTLSSPVSSHLEQRNQTPHMDEHRTFVHFHEVAFYSRLCSHVEFEVAEANGDVSIELTLFTGEPPTTKAHLSP
ncbi:hypothetical protein K1719_031229 [Acacia pycnantha]|nr:hypothetical protein K1719_031229 [Acacia pycnantha]